MTEPNGYTIPARYDAVTEPEALVPATYDPTRDLDHQRSGEIGPQQAPQQYAMPAINIVNNNVATATASAGTVAVGTKSIGWAYFWLLILGVVGGHKFYLGRFGMGVLYIFTAGLLGVGLVYDLFTLPRQVRARNLGL